MLASGYDYEAVNEIPEELKCTMCHLILKDAMELPCAHAFCRECLYKWEKNENYWNDEALRIVTIPPILK